VLHGLGLSIYAGEDLPLTDGLDEKQAGGGTATTPKISATVSSFPEKRGDTITPAQLSYIERLIKETGTELQKLLDYFGHERLPDIPKAEASRVIRSLEQSRSRKEAA